MPKPPLITRVKLRNYKSISRCDVALGPLGILVGPNGSGKSNFLDALALASDAMLMSMPRALSMRGGCGEVIRRGPDNPDHFAIGMQFELADRGVHGRYEFEIALRADGTFEVSKEICEFSSDDNANETMRFVVRSGEIVESPGPVRLPKAAADRLFLINASNIAGFREVYDAIADMFFYQFNIPEIRRNLPRGQSTYLLPPGGDDLASVLGFLENRDPMRFDRIQRYMQAIVPGIQNISSLEIPGSEHGMIQFTQQFGDRKCPQRFTALNMSDGTLRALAVLVALLQGGDRPPSLVGIEEPETALHPAAAGVLWDALTDASDRAQILVSTQSPDLLDRDDIPTDAILAVDMDAGKTEIAPVVESSRTLLRERLATPGELLRQNMLSPRSRAYYPQCPLPDSRRSP